jgi:hypothetical protein
MLYPKKENFDIFSLEVKKQKKKNFFFFTAERVRYLQFF